MGARSRTVAVAALALAVAPFPAAGQAAGGTNRVDTLSTAAGDSLAEPGRVFRLRGLNVTATRELREVFETPVPVTVLPTPSRPLDGPVAMLRAVPGVDVEGVGTSQMRPVIRGLSGQRVLLLEDGIRLNNPRRRRESGEPPSLAGIGSVERVEVVRGPASVLYGSDALGGVVNLVSRPAGGERPLAGTLELQTGTASDEGRARLALFGEVAGLAYRVAAAARTTSPYVSPAGTFGDVVLDESTWVHDTGVRDRDVRIALAYRAGGAHLRARFEAYRARDGGFGYVDPALLGESARVRITTPDQRFRRWSVDAELRPGGLADRVDVTLFRQDNDRTFVTDVRVEGLGPNGPDAVMDVTTTSFTDLAATGVRAEARKVLGPALLTYGLDVVRDRSRGADTTRTNITGLGPPIERTSPGLNLPEATMLSVGGFAQGRWEAGPSTELVAGARYQAVNATPEATGTGDGGAHRDDALVGSLALLRRLDEHVNLRASVSRGFRSPNLVERFFAGATPGNRAFWVRNPDLGPETSLTVDVGVRVRTDRFAVEVGGFRTVLRDGIRQELTGREVEGVPELTNVNVDELRFRGLEAQGSFEVAPGTALTAGHTWLDAENGDDPDDPVTETYRNRTTLGLRQDIRRGGWAELSARIVGTRRVPEGSGGPVGDVIPGFEVVDLAAGWSFGGGHELTLSVENVFDALYAESLDVSFFRPQPGRRLSARLIVGF